MICDNDILQGKNTDWNQPREEAHRAQSKRVTKQGTFSPMESWTAYLFLAII